GLGLGIVRRLVRRLDGEITCHSAPGQGARFRVELPVVICPPAPPEALSETVSDAAPETGSDKASDKAPVTAATAGPPRRLLLVDDNEINRDLLGIMLRRMGHEVTLAEGGAEAITLAAAHRYDAILMDISMPGISGVQATRTIQSAADSRNRATPIIPVTAHALPHEREEFRAAGMTGFLQKPVDRAALARSIAELTPQARPDPAEKTPSDAVSEAGPEAAASPQPSGPPQPPVLNDTQVADLSELLGPAQLRERLTRLEEQIDRDLPALLEATATADIQARAHALAGLCGMFGMDRLHARLKAIETACKTATTPGAQTGAQAGAQMGTTDDPEGPSGQELRAARAQMPPLAALWEDARAAWHARLG
ncbi:MAG: response regulator, partial [Marinobacter sp.]